MQSALNEGWELQPDGSIRLSSDEPDGVAAGERAEEVYELREVADQPTLVPIPPGWVKLPAGVEMIRWEGSAVVKGARWRLDYTFRRKHPVALPPLPGQTREAVYWTTKELSAQEAQQWALEVVSGRSPLEDMAA